MSSNPQECPKCAGGIIEGLTLDFTGDNIRREQALWFGTKLKRKDVRTVDAFRCGKCGFLELYARDKRTDLVM